MDELDQLLDTLRQHRWAFHYYGPDRTRLTSIVAMYRWQHYADVIIIRSEDDSIAYRVPINEDFLAPREVAWWYDEKSTLWNLRAVLTLDPPDAQTDRTRIPAPPAARIPDDERKPVTIRLPHRRPGLALRSAELPGPPGAG